MSDQGIYNAVVIGAGFYGCSIASYLARNRGFEKILVLDQEQEVMLHASYNNQARVHNGYHYPRSFTTAYRSRLNLPRFIKDWPSVVRQDLTSLYAIARYGSKVTAGQFYRFCKQIGAQIEVADRSLSGLFSPRLVEEVFEVEEFVFDSARLAEALKLELAKCGVELRLQRKVKSVFKDGGSYRLEVDGAARESYLASYVFNCTYSGLAQLGGDFGAPQTGLKHEIAEMALVKAPLELRKLGITVMDGPFFSMLPFPDKGLHTLSHVRYTPHCSWPERGEVDPYGKLSAYDHHTRVDRMLRDVARYLPVVRNAEYRESLFEIKTVLAKNESDDGRPILFERHQDLPGCYSVLGGKIDNVYDVLERLDREELQLESRRKNQVN